MKDVFSKFRKRKKELKKYMIMCSFVKSQELLNSEFLLPFQETEVDFTALNCRTILTYIIGFFICFI